MDIKKTLFELKNKKLSKDQRRSHIRQLRNNKHMLSNNDRDEIDNLDLTDLIIGTAVLTDSFIDHRIESSNIDFGNESSTDDSNDSRDSDYGSGSGSSMDSGNDSDSGGDSGD